MTVEIERWNPRWPDGRGSAAMLTFDVDGLTLWVDRATDPDPASIGRAISLGNYGPETAMPRILSMLERLGIPATFFVPSYIAENFSDPIRAAVAAGHEIGLHGHMHETFHGRTDDDQRALIERSRDIFRARLCYDPTGFRAPSGDWEASTPRILTEAGLTYSSSYRGDDRPFRWHTEDGSSLVEIPGHWELDDFPQFAYNDVPAAPDSQDRPGSTRRTFENWEWEFEASADEGLAWVLMTHPQIIGTPHRLSALEALLTRMQERGDVWFATGRDIAAWVDGALASEPGTREVER